MAHRRSSRELGSHKIIPVNSSNKDYTNHRFVLWFGGPYSATNLLVWADHLQDALDEAVDWIVDHKPGLLADEEVADEYKRLKAEGKSDEEAMEEAEVDTTTAGNAGNYLHSWEWGIVSEDPTREELLEIERRPAEKRAKGTDPLTVNRGVRQHVRKFQAHRRRG